MTTAPVTSRRPSSYQYDPSPLKLSADTYTAHRLQHATPEHLYLTTRRCFIGPIPEGWLKTHRRDWYKHHLHINYSSRKASLNVNTNISRHRRLSGLDGLSAAAIYGQSFPQPTDALAEEDEEVDEDDQADGDQADATTDVPPAVSIPRATNLSDAFVQTAGTDENADYSGRPPQLRSRPEQPAAPRPTKSQRDPRLEGRKRRRSTTTSFVTAYEELSPTAEEATNSALSLGVNGTKQSPVTEEAMGATVGPASLTDSSAGGNSLVTGEAPHATSSTTSLLRNTRADQMKPQSRPDTLFIPKTRPARTTKNTQSSQSGPQPGDGTSEAVPASGVGRDKRVVTSGTVRFNVPEDPNTKERQMKARMIQMAPRRRTFRRLRRGKMHDGEIIKMEKMLVRVDATVQQLPDDFDENDSLKIDTRAIEKWREFMLVCRESTDEDAEFTLQLYKTRVIPATEETHVKDHSKHEIPLDHRTTKVNLFSSLDKTIVVWLPWRKGTMIYIMQAHSGANAVEWYTFLRNILGWQRSDLLHVNVPDLGVSLRLEKPFEQLEASRDIAQAAGGDEEAIVRTMQEEQAIAGRIIDRCMEMLEQSPEWGDVVESWAKGARMGLVWKRYDRLEWVHGANEKRMYGTIAMQKSHELELRPKQHYPTAVERVEGTSITEPAPVEGFLIRLTSQRGVGQRMGKMFFKRLYFSTHNQFLVFCRPAKALPPPPPKLPMREDSSIPNAHQIAEKIPLIYAVNPYPVQDAEVAWLAPEHPGNGETRQRHDRDAYDEAERTVNTFLNCDGYISLCDVVKIRDIVRGATLADNNVDEGSDVEFNEEVPDTLQDDGITQDIDDSRTFELVLQNDLVIRLQAFDKATKREWQRRLRHLVRYWKLRTAADIALFKSVRRRNLELLKIDEEIEAFMGQFARKWEVTNSFASPVLYNMCGISCCRTITMSGILFRKPRRHSTFTRCSVILCHGKLLTFQDTLRTLTGAEVAHVHYERTSTLDLKDCYIYSGLITENDLLYQNQTFDSNNPGHHILPRIYREDGWTSTDEDTMTCFVIWHGQRRSFFRSADDGSEESGGKRQRLKVVSRLGVPGRSIVFKTRSRAERDHWVLSIAMEIERLQQGEDVRIVEKS